MVNNKATEKEFEDYVTYLGGEISRLSDYVALYQRLEELKADHLEEMNFAPFFFGVTIDALFSVIVLWIDKLFDEKGQRGLFNFLAFVEKNIDLFRVAELQRRQNYPDGHWMLDRDAVTIESVEVDRQKLRQCPARKAISLRRNKFHAHFDKKYFFNRAALDQEAPISWEELTEAVKLTQETVNKYSSHHDGSATEFMALNCDDVNGVLKAIREWRQFRLQELESALDED
ncbi:MAG TPA: hypothetical protein PLP17_08990 [Oligoflexia bacterium]|nr:hypothetical protein [Oligoflexia bacterium]